MEQPKTKQKITLAFYGDGSVGKTSIVQVYDNGKFSEDQLQTVGTASVNKTIYINEKKTIITIYDTAGQTKFKTINVNLLKNAEGIILVYAVNNAESFNSIKTTRENLIKTHPKATFMVLVGNKTDLDQSEWQVTSEQGKQLANELNLPFFETSAKSGTNVENVFKKLISDIYKKKFNEGVKDWSYEQPVKVDIGGGKGTNEVLIGDVGEIQRETFCKKFCGCLFGKKIE